MSTDVGLCLAVSAPNRMPHVGLIWTGEPIRRLHLSGTRSSGFFPPFEGRADCIFTGMFLHEAPNCAKEANSTDPFVSQFAVFIKALEH